MRFVVRWRLGRSGGYLQSFSPDGRRVLAVVAPDRLVVRRSDDGGIVTALAIPQGLDSSVLVWESATTWLGVVTREKRSAVVRITADGSLERVSPLRRQENVGGQ